MNREEFYEKVRSELGAFFGSGQTVRLVENLKNNDTPLRGVTLAPESAQMVPVVYLEPYYERVREGQPMGKVLAQLASDLEAAGGRAPSLVPKDLSFEAIQDQLRVRVVDEKSNRERLKDLVYLPLPGGMAMTVYLELPSQGESHAQIQITRSLMASRGYREGELFQIGMENAMNALPPVLSSIEEFLFSGDREGPKNLLEQDRPVREDEMLVLTNATKELGAAALYYPGIQEKVAELVGGNYYVLPSSVHEVLIVPEKGPFTASQLLKTVMEINEREVAPQEKLADRVLFFHAQRQQLRIAAEPERERSMQKEKELWR